MTIDWFVVLAPLVLLVVAMPFLFVGCAKFDAAPDATTHDSGSRTTFRFEMDPNLQNDLGAQRKVTRIEVFFRIQDSTGALAAIERPQPHRLIVNTQMPAPTPPAIDPGREHVLPVEVPNTDIGNRDQVVCNCSVILANGDTPNVQVPKATSIDPGHTHEFRVRSRRPQQNGFQVYFNGTGG